MYKEIEANIWSFENNVKVVTTNGNVRRTGTAVMGKGLAVQAIQRFPELPLIHGEYVKKNGIKTVYYPQYNLIMFPTKTNWWENSTYSLIRKSMKELLKICIDNNIKQVIMPRVGCSNGRLNWIEVRKEIIDILETTDVEFVIVNL